MRTVIVPSETDPSKNYLLKVEAIACDCPSFVFRNGGQEPCKHMRAYNGTIDKSDEME